MVSMSSNVMAAAGTSSRRADSWTSGRAATVVALFAVLLAVSAVVLFVPVAPTTAAGTQLVTAAAAEQFVEDTHVKACPGQVPAVTCTAAGAGWSCRWTGGATQVARTPDAAFALAC
jgi:hypothetical protein